MSIHLYNIEDNAGFCYIYRPVCSMAAEKAARVHYIKPVPVFSKILMRMAKQYDIRPAFFRFLCYIIQAVPYIICIPMSIKYFPTCKRYFVFKWQELPQSLLPRTIKKSFPGNFAFISSASSAPSPRCITASAEGCEIIAFISELLSPCVSDTTKTRKNKLLSSLFIRSGTSYLFPPRHII